MPSPPAARLLQLLELLQARPLVTGQELSDRLSIDRRTVRRDVAVLQELGIPIEGCRGVGGGYRLRPGYRLPPLMFTDDEVIAVALGLALAQRQGLDAADDALAKIQRVLPDTLRRRLDALEATLAMTGRAAAGAPIVGSNVLLLAEAIRQRGRVRVRYRSAEGATSNRELSPYGLVVHAGRWYLAAHDHLRDDLRTFRVDRLTRVTAHNAQALPPPERFDPIEHVGRSLARIPWPWTVEVLLHVPIDRAAELLPSTLAEFEEAAGGTRMHMRVSSLDWAAALLCGLDCDFAVIRPPELRSSIGRLADRLRRIATAAD